MSDLPFSRRVREVRDCGPPKPRSVFDDVIFHTPLNQQTITSRSIQTGTYRARDIKSPVRRIDGRLDQVERNRENLLFSSPANVPYAPQSARTTFSPPTTRRLTTRHDYTPYDYDTEWISHPSSDTSMAAPPSETFKTSFLATPVSDLDKSNKKLSNEQKFNYLRTSQQHFLDYVDTIDGKKKNQDLNTIKSHRNQESDYFKSLDLRQQHEHIYIFK